MMEQRKKLAELESQIKEGLRQELEAKGAILDPHIRKSNAIGARRWEWGDGANKKDFRSTRLQPQGLCGD